MKVELFPVYVLLTSIAINSVSFSAFNKRIPVYIKLTAHFNLDNGNGSYYLSGKQKNANVSARLLPWEAAPILSFFY